MAILFAFLSGLYLSLISWLYTVHKINVYYFIFFTCLLSGFFSTYLSHDSIAYQDLFSHYSVTHIGNIFNEMIGYEFFFLFTAKLFSFFPMFVFFFLYAVLSFSIKLALIERVSRNPTLSLLCFFAVFFLYLDGTVVRVSLGIAVAYWGIYLLSKNNLFYFIAVILLSSAIFHYSLIVLLMMPFFKSHFSIKIILFMMLFFLVMYFLDFGILGFLSTVIGYINSSYAGVDKLISYLNKSQVSYPYSMVFIALFIASLLGYYLFKDELNSFELIAFNMLFLSFLFLVALYQSQALQNRISEIFRYSLIFVAPLFYYALRSVLIRPRCAMIVYCFFLGGYFFYYYYFKEIISDKNLGLLHAIFF